MSSDREPLVKGGVYQGVQYHDPPRVVGAGTESEIAPPLSFATTAPPNIEPDTIIIAAASPNVANSRADRDGWFISDFWAFNYLLKGLGSRQVWLTTADPHKLVEAGSNSGQEVFLHGNPYEDRRIVLSRDMLAKGEITVPQVVANQDITSRFLEEVRRGSEEAVKRNAPLLLLVFCHGNPLVLHLDYASARLGPKSKDALKISQLKEAIHPHCRVTMYTTACYSGGWVVSQPGDLHMDMTMLAAADRKKLSNSWQLSSSIGRACGSIFASTAIAALTSATSPLLENPSAQSEAPEDSLQPEIPDAEQTASFNSFCRSILDTCSSSVTRLAGRESFTFSAQSDQWELSWTKRTGIPLADFKERWEALEVYPFNPSNDPALTEKAKLCNPSPLNAEWENEGESRAGGSSEEIDEANIKARIIAAQINNDTREIARLFLEACPGDAETPKGHRVRGYILDYIRDEELEPDDPTDVPAMITYMLELTRLADYLVRIFDLPVPDQRCCLMWHRHEWGDKMRRKGVDFENKRDAAWGHLWDAGVYPEQGPGQGMFFDRFVSYLAAAIAEKDQSAEQDQEIVEQMAAFVDRLRRFHRERAVALALQNRDVIQRGRDWLKKVGRSVRRSMSPQKSPSREMRQRAESSASQHSRGSSRGLGDIPALQPSTPPRGSSELKRSKSARSSKRGSSDLQRSGSQRSSHHFGF